MKYINQKPIGEYNLLTVDEWPWLTTLCRWLSPWFPFLADETRFYIRVYKDGPIWYKFSHGGVIDYYTGLEFDRLIRNQKLLKVKQEYQDEF